MVKKMTGVVKKYMNNNQVSNNEQVTLINFLRHKTAVSELCVIRESGWITTTVYIDCEDLFRIPPKMYDYIVKSDEWSVITIVDKYGRNIRIPCHIIDV